MDLEALQGAAENIEICLKALGYSALGLGAILGAGCIGIKYKERKDLVKKMMDEYEKGNLTEKPDIFNIKRMTHPKTAHHYRVYKA